MRTQAKHRRLQRFCDCGGSLWLHQDGTELVLTSNCCHDRLCEPCQQARRAALVERLLAEISGKEKRVRFVTLTLKCQPVTLAAQIDRLIASFRRLRQRKFWTSTVTGGAWFLEVKLGKNSHDWHVHLHLMTESGFLDNRTLSQEWHAVTGDSYIVDVDTLGDARRRAAYVTKYATKPLDSTVILSPPHLDQAVLALRGRRLFGCFGTWKALALDDDTGPCTLTPIGSVDMLICNARNGDAEALRWVQAAERKWPGLCSHFGAPPPPTIEAPS